MGNRHGHHRQHCDGGGWPMGHQQYAYPGYTNHGMSFGQFPHQNAGYGFEPHHHGHHHGGGFAGFGHHSGHHGGFGGSHHGHHGHH